MKRSKESFISQFPYKITNIEEIKDVMSLDEESSKLYEGVEVYRALNILLIKVGDQFYSHS